MMLPVQLNKSRAAAARSLYGLGPEQLLGKKSAGCEMCVKMDFQLRRTRRTCRDWAPTERTFSTRVSGNVLVSLSLPACNVSSPFRSRPLAVVSCREVVAVGVQSETEVSVLRFRAAAAGRHVCAPVDAAGADDAWRTTEPRRRASAGRRRVDRRPVRRLSEYVARSCGCSVLTTG